jgi:hypothetical protein
VLAYQFHLEDFLPGVLKSPYVTVAMIVVLLSTFFLLDRRKPMRD